jgi:hypothetical protein
MSTMDDGGPAFPTTESAESVNHPGHREVYASAGMSLRDYFAGQALAGLMAKHGMFYYGWTDGDPNARAEEQAYKMADAMLAVRATKATP